MSRETMQPRAWDGKKMWTVLALCWHGRPMVTLQFNPVVKVPLDDLVLMYPTGLKDKNGVEIYEGDIVRCVFKDCCNNIDWVILAFWDEWWLRFWFKRKTKEGYWDKSFVNNPETLEVIGSIHANPELLKGE